MVAISGFGAYTITYAEAVNSSNAAVGTALTSGRSQRAFVWSSATGTVDLNTLLAPGQGVGYVLGDASSINDQGQIAGTAYFGNNNEIHAYLLTPVPEPATCVVAAMGVAGLLVRRKRKTTC